MFNKIENGSVMNVQGLDCNIPPVGYVFDIRTKQLEYVGVYSRSENPSEQYWEIPKLPSWYKNVMLEWDNYDKHKKDDAPDFYDDRLEQFKEQEWNRRLNGFWFMNNGTPCFITGLYYLYLVWWKIDVGSPSFRIPDLEKFYFLDYCINDPLCMGAVEVTKRRFGKSFVAGLFIVEYVSRTKMAFGGIQSKTGKDAGKFFSKTVVNPFRRLPKFFRPEYDMSLGANPKSEIRFQKTNVRGKKAESQVDKSELGGGIDHQPSDKVAYDGQKIHRYVGDEAGKCFAKGTKVRMWDGSVKNIEDIENGELVMGDDSSSRLVYGKTKGVEEMFKIIPNKGKPFVCNKSHILSLSVSDRIYVFGKKYVVGDVLTISISDYLKLSESTKKCLCLYRVGWDLPKREHKIDPYTLGVWLGDGNSRDFSITNTDKEIVNHVYEFAKQQNLNIRVKEDNISYHVTSNLVGVNHVTKELRRLNLLKNKHIPTEYLLDSRDNRLQLLAGLIDTDGHVNSKQPSSKIEITQKRKILAENLAELAISVGFYASVNKKKARMKRVDGSCYVCDVYRVGIYGDVDQIPTKVKHKKIYVSRTKNRRNPLKTGFSVKSVGVGEYYGFAVNNNHLFLLDDGTVVHNTVEVDVYERHEVVRYCLLDDGGNIIGKALYTTTVEKVESEKTGVQDAFKLLWEESDQDQRGENGMTRSGLYRFFMPAKRTRYFDKYGYPDEEKTLAAILADRRSVESNPRALNARIRKEPLTIEEAFLEDAEDCVFNMTNITNREAELREKPIYKRNVIFDIDPETQKVFWRDATKSELDFCWRFSPSAELNISDNNKFIIENGKQKPARTNKGAIAIDSYSNSQGGRKYGSKCSAWVGRRLDIDDPDNTGKPVGHLYGRPKEKDELHKQVMLCGIYFGYPIYYEHTADDYDGYFGDRGKRGYLGLYPMSLIDRTKKEKKELHRGTPITPFSITKQLDNGIAYFEKYTHKIDFEEVFPFAKKFRPDERTEYDMIVSLLILITVLFEPLRRHTSRTSPLIQTYT